MLKLDNIRLVRFEPEYHTVKLYEWYYSGDYPEFFRDYPQCPSALEIAQAAQGKTFMVVLDNENAPIIGMIRFFGVNETARNFELGLLIERPYQKKRHALIALKSFLNWKFNYCNFFKAKMKVMAENKDLCNSLDRFGASREGLLRKESFFKGKFHDLVAYTIFKTDFNQLYLTDFETSESRLEPPIEKGSSDGRSRLQQPLHVVQ